MPTSYLYSRPRPCTRGTGETDDARDLYQDVPKAEPDWPEAMDRYFSFIVDQGDAQTLCTAPINYSHDGSAVLLRQASELHHLAGVAEPQATANYKHLPKPTPMKAAIVPAVLSKPSPTDGLRHPPTYVTALPSPKHGIG